MSLFVYQLMSQVVLMVQLIAYIMNHRLFDYMHLNIELNVYVLMVIYQDYTIEYNQLTKQMTSNNQQTHRLKQREKINTKHNTNMIKHTYWWNGTYHSCRRSTVSLLFIHLRCTLQYSFDGFVAYCAHVASGWTFFVPAVTHQTGERGIRKPGPPKHKQGRHGNTHNKQIRSNHTHWFNVCA